MLYNNTINKKCTLNYKAHHTKDKQIQTNTHILRDKNIKGTEALATSCANICT